MPMRNPHGMSGTSFCLTCRLTKPASAFTYSADAKRFASRCRECKHWKYLADKKSGTITVKDKSLAYYYRNRDRILKRVREERASNLGVSLYRYAKKRAKDKGVPFEICVEDIIVPEVCPVFGMKLMLNSRQAGPNSPSLDRIDNKYGYIRGNIIVVSSMANTIKNNATPAELLTVARFYMALESASSAAAP